VGIGSLIAQAQQAGITIEVKGDKLVLRGRGESLELAKEIGKRKKEVIDYFQAPRVERFSYLGPGDGTTVIPEKNGGCVATPQPQTAFPGGRKDDPIRWGNGSSRRLVGNGYPPRPRPTVPASILATPRVTCPACGAGMVLTELRGLCSGLCYECWRGGSKP